MFSSPRQLCRRPTAFVFASRPDPSANLAFSPGQWPAICLKAVTFPGWPGAGRRLKKRRPAVEIASWPYPAFSTGSARVLRRSVAVPGHSSPSRCLGTWDGHLRRAIPRRCARGRAPSVTVHFTVADKTWFIAKHVPGSIGEKGRLEPAGLGASHGCGAQGRCCARHAHEATRGQDSNEN